jgi:hypothetical protein
LQKKEFLFYASAFGCSEDLIGDVVRLSGYGRVRPLKNLQRHLCRVNEALKDCDLSRILNFINQPQSSDYKNPSALLIGCLFKLHFRRR